MIPEIFIGNIAKEAVKALYGVEADDKMIKVESTNPDFEGDVTLVVFPLLRMSKKAPEATATEIGEYIKANDKFVENFNVVKGFLNIKLSQEYWKNIFVEISAAENFGQLPATGKSVMIEFSSPNTNKPLHLGHIRNNLLGWSVSRLLEANGHTVIRVNLVNDRGIHICKSMLAWLKMGNGETPESSGIKGDHLVGKYYVAFSNELKKQTKELIEQGRRRNRLQSLRRPRLCL